MKILMVNKFLFPKGGAETYFLELGKQLEKMGHKVEYFGMYDGKNVVGNELDVSVSPVDFHKQKMDFETLTYPFRIIWSQEAYDKMSALIERFEPDVIHLNNFNYQLTPSIIQAAKKHHVRVVYTAHDSQLLCANHLLYDAKHNTICTKCVSTKNPWNCFHTACIHGSYARSLVGTIENLKYRKDDTYSRINAIVCPSQFIKQIYDTDSRFKYKTVLMPNYVTNLPVKNGENSENGLKVRSKEEIKELIHSKKDSQACNSHGGYLFYFGRLSPEKGILNIIDVAKKMPDTRFKLAGVGEEPYISMLKQVPNIELCGFKQGKELETLIRNAMLVILPSTCYENCPMAVIEAQKLGAAVLVPNQGGAVELVHTNHIIYGTSSKDLYEALQEILNKDEDEKIKILKEMMLDSVENVTQMPTLEQYAKKLVSEVY